MRTSIDDNFLLDNSIAEHLFHEVVKDLPIIDYHNHLNPADLASNRQFTNIAELWLTGDPYKHRAMRIHGIPESHITGDAGDRQKFISWAKTFKMTMGNPLYIWTNLELKRIFDVDELLCEESAGEIWEHCNSLLTQSDFRAMGLTQQWGAETICTSDDLIDDLTPHLSASQNGETKVLPSLRGDSIIAFNSTTFLSWLSTLALASGEMVRNLDQYKTLITNQLDKFSAAQCRLADHSLDGGFTFIFRETKNFDALFSQVLRGKTLSTDQLRALQTHFMLFLGKEYHRRGWALQLHIGAQRQTSRRLRKLAGPTGGYAGIGRCCDIDGLCRFLDMLEVIEGLPKTILYTLNPADNAAFATLTGSYSEDHVAGKIQFGPAWWYNDHHQGIIQHLNVLSSHGLLGHFIGMTTDSRSLLSFSRHEYFRRILCGFIGEGVKNKLFPDDIEVMAEFARNITYQNVKKYLNV